MDYIKKNNIYDEISISSQAVKYANITIIEHEGGGKDTELMYKIEDETLLADNYYDNDEYCFVKFFLGKENNYNTFEVAIRKDSYITQKSTRTPTCS